MTKFRSLILVLAGGIFMFSCDKTDPLPTASVAFEVVTPLPEVGIEIDFHNNTINGNEYEWNFGDGSAISKDVNPSHVYEQSGTYNVVLKAITKDNQISTDSLTVQVGVKRLTSFLIRSFPRLNEEGNLWNDSIGANVFTIFGPTTELEKYLQGGDPDLESMYFSPIIVDVGGVNGMPVGEVEIEEQFTITIEEDVEYSILVMNYYETDEEPDGVIDIIDYVGEIMPYEFPRILVDENEAMISLNWFYDPTTKFGFDLYYKVVIL